MQQLVHHDTSPLCRSYVGSCLTLMWLALPSLQKLCTAVIAQVCSQLTYQDSRFPYIVPKALARHCSCIVVKISTGCPTWDCVGSVAVTVDEMQVAVDGLATAADWAPAHACLSSICSPCMLLYMVRKPRGCLTEAGKDLMLPLDAPLQQESVQ